MTHLLMNLGRRDAGNSANAKLLYGRMVEWQTQLTQNQSPKGLGVQVPLRLPLMKKILSLLLLASLLLSGCVSAPPREVFIEKVIVVHEYPATIWNFGISRDGGYYRHGPWRK
jgi:hypothetical protein